MEEIDYVKIKKDAKSLIIKQNFHLFGVYIFYFMIKSLYSLIKLATFGITTILTSTLVFPITINNCQKLILFTQNKKTKWYYIYLLYANFFYALKQSFLNFCIKLASYLLALAFIMPGIVFAYRFTFLPYVIAENKNFTYKQTLAYCLEITRGKTKQLIAFFFPFFAFTLLSIITLGLSSFYSVSYLNNAKTLLYLELVKKHNLQKKIKTSLLGSDEDL